MTQMSFREFQSLFQQHFMSMVEGQDHLYRVDVSKDDLWEAYINSYPEDIRQEFNCNACRRFVKQYGNLVAITETGLETIWSFTVEDPIYQVSLDNLASLCLTTPIKDVFVSDTAKLGCESNLQLLESGEVVRWYHLALTLPQKLVTLLHGSTKATIQNKLRTQVQVFRRSLEEITTESVVTVLELIASDSIYRGSEFKALLEQFRKTQREWHDSPNQELFYWKRGLELSASIAKIRNTAIGTLLTDLSDGMSLDQAVRKFEGVMAPANYKRPKPLITARMISEAERDIAALNLTESLGRRFATVDDLKVSNLIFVDRTKAETISIFQELKEAVPLEPKKFSRVQEITIQDFISNIVPNAQSIELLFENSHISNLFSLIAPVNNNSTSLFKWDNGFSWTYKGSVADSLKEKVKRAGGQIGGVLRCSLEWFNYDDLDLHLIEPSGFHISYERKRSYKTGGFLDVDMNAGGHQTRTPVENISYFQQPPTGNYHIFVHQFRRIEAIDFGFNVELEYRGQLHSFGYTEPMRKGDSITVAKFEIAETGALKIIESLDPLLAQREEWGLKTNLFHPVKMMLLSPNHWEQPMGNKHYFFVLENARNTDENVRGFYNEFLKEELLEHKRVFEVLADRLRVQPQENQVSGLGFSSTRRNSIIARVKGQTDRILKVTF